MDTICELKNVSKIYHKKYVIKNISLQLEQGTIYGFIGKNGAGKTTTMRMITGLAFPTSGSIILDGETGERNLTEKRKKIGCIIESPALYLDMTAKQNLKSLCILYGISFHVINDILSMVGLDNESRKKVKHFSLGMKQRLGIGMALVNNPKFLILDEPINGLDPDGIVEVRNLLKKISRDRNTTILISSHILSELYQTVDNYIIINEGEIIETLTQKELEQKTKKHILIKDRNKLKLRMLLNQMKLSYEETRDGAIKLYCSTDEMLDIMNTLVSAGIHSEGISISEDSLEKYFFKRIGE